MTTRIAGRLERRSADIPVRSNPEISVVQVAPGAHLRLDVPVDKNVRARVFPALLIAVLVVAGCSKPAPPAGLPTPTVTVNQPIPRDVFQWDEYPGRLEPVAMVEVRARITGYLQEIHFKDGALVEKGDLLFVIDPRPYRAELDHAEAELKQAQTRLDLAVNDLARAEPLLASKAISAEEADSRNKAKREAEAATQSARAMVEMAKLNLDYTHVTAPISGRVSRKLITEGNLVNGNQGQSTLLTTIVSLEPIYCYFEPDERAVLKYRDLAKQGTQESMWAGKAPCELELANEKGFPHKGVLDFVDSQVDATTGTLRIRGVFPNPAPDYVLQPGFFARVRVPGDAKYQGLLIPDQALSTDQGQRVLYVVNDQNTVEYRRVKLGPLVDGLRVIREGIQAGDWVVVNGLMSARPGAKVAPQKARIGEAPVGKVPPAR